MLTETASYPFCANKLNAVVNIFSFVSDIFTPPKSKRSFTTSVYIIVNARLLVKIKVYEKEPDNK